MNERIKELIKQVGTDVSGKWINVDNAEKLAELIVKECVDTLTTRHNTFKGTGEYGRGFKSGLTAANATVKEHFGVEE
jgi:hypothetical protein